MTDQPAARSASHPTITADALYLELADGDLTVVDVRPLSAFNGWRVGDEPRGGHIPGAVAFPAAWFGSVDPTEIGRLLGAKGVVAGRRIVVLGRDDGESSAVADALRALRIPDVRILTGGFGAWIADPDRAVEKLARHERLVHIEWLGQLLAGGRPEAAPSGRFLLFHVNFGVPEEYAEGHLPGALCLDTNWLEDPDNIWQRRTPAELEAAVRARNRMRYSVRTAGCTCPARAASVGAP